MLSANSKTGVPWGELAASTAATVALFAVALASMTSVSSNARSRADNVEARARIDVTFLTPRVETDRPPPKPVRPRPQERNREPSPTPRPPEPVVVPAPVSAPPPDTGAKPSAPVRLTDITIPRERVEFRASGPSARPSGLGAPAAPAGLTDNSRIATAAAATSARDSAFAAWAQATHDSVRWSAISAATTKQIAESQRQALQTAQRTTTAGNSRDVHVMSGKGVDGVGAVGGGLGSIGLPLFSRGRSREQRMRDSVIDAEIRAGLARSAARIAAKRDSIRADSIRADSARRVAQSRKP